MARKSQHRHQGPSPAGDQHPAQQSSTTSHNQVDAKSKAKTIEELVAPVFSFPFTTTYASELETPEFKDMLVTIEEIATQATAQDQRYLNYENQIQYTYVPVTRPWDQQSQIQQGEYSSQNQTPFDVWENQTPIEEPFDNVREVAFESAGRRPGEGYDRELRRGKERREAVFEL